MISSDAETSPTDLDTAGSPKRFRITKWIWSHLDIVVTVFLAFGISVTVFSQHHSPAVLMPFNSVDQSWALDVAVMRQHNLWLGGDASFTYGPLAQWMWSVTPRLCGFSVGSVFKYRLFFPWLYQLSVLFVVANILLRGHDAWKRAFYVFVLTVFWGFYDPRVATNCLIFAVAIYTYDKIAIPGSEQLFWSALVAGMVAISSLISADTGAYSLAGCLIVAASYLFWFRSDVNCLWTILKFTLMTLGILLIFMLVLSSALAGSFSVEFWKTSFAIIQSYRWAVAKPMDMHLSHSFLWTISGLALIALAGWIWRSAQTKSFACRPVYLISAPLFCLLLLQSSIVRTDAGHVAFGLFAAVVLIGAILIGPAEGLPVLGNLPLYASVGLTAAFAGPIVFYTPRTFAQDVLKCLRPAANHCPPWATYFSDACFLAADFSRMQAVSSYVANHTSEHDPVFVFPYEDVYPNLANRVAAGGIVQNYAVNGHVLEQIQISQLEKQKPSLAIYSVDSIASLPVDGIPSFTRTPEVWLYLQSNYRQIAEPVPGIPILQRDEERHQHWRIITRELPVSSQPAVRVLRGWDVPVSDHIAWPADADLLKLSLTIRYPFSWHFRKPYSLSVTLQLADHTKKVVDAVAEPGKLTEIWVYPWAERQLANYFRAGSDSWRQNASTPPLSSVKVNLRRMDWISVPPLDVYVTKLEAVKLSLDPSPQIMGPPRLPPVSGLFN